MCLNTPLLVFCGAAYFQFVFSLSKNAYHVLSDQLYFITKKDLEIKLIHRNLPTRSEIHLQIVYSEQNN